MWILRIALVASVLVHVNCLTCHEPCETNHKSCVLQTNEKNGTCTLRCSEKENLNDQCKSSAGNFECYCEEDNCHKKPSTIANWKLSLSSLSLELSEKVDVCIDDTAALKKLTCGAVCGKTSHRSCAVNLQENEQFKVMCSKKNGSGNVCSSIGSNGLECLCEGDDCHKGSDMVLIWLKQLEDKFVSNPSLVEKFEGGLKRNGWLKLSDVLTCNGKQCYEGRDRSCQFHIKKNEDCTGTCSYKRMNDKCQTIGNDHIVCSCKSKNCHKGVAMRRDWTEDAASLINGASDVETCLYKTGAFSKKKCGDVKCWFGNDKSCKLIVPSEAEKCTFECSNEDYVADNCTSDGCLCKDGNCNQREETVTKWRKHPKKPNGLDTCLVKRNVLSTKKCGVNHCFKNKDKSCILAFKLDGKGCDVECSAEAATNQCKKKNQRIECSAVTEDFKANPQLIRSLIGQPPEFKKNAEQCLQNHKLLKKKTDKCGEERCFFGYDFCELWFDDTQCKVGCTTKNGTNSECNKVDGKSEHHCVCKGDGCYMKEKIIEQLIVIQKSTELSGVEKCLKTKGVLTTKTCGKTPCFIGFDKSCEVEAKMDGSCAVGCSKEVNFSDKCQVSNNDTAVQCYCADGGCHKEQKKINLWQKDLDAKNAVLTNKLEECLHEQDALDKSIKCGNQQCYKGRDTCKLEGKADGNCIVECSTEKIDNSRCKKNGNEYHCLCNTEDCLTSKSTMNKWLEEVEAMHLNFPSKLETCLHDKGYLEKSFKCGHQQCFEGRDTCKLEARNKTCSVECSTEKSSNLKCTKIGHVYQCYCENENCLQSKDTMSEWKTTIVSSGPDEENITRCIDEIEARITTAAPPTTTTFVQSGTRTEKIESGEESSSSKNAQFVFFFVFVKMF